MDILTKMIPKKDQTRDLRLVFSEREQVRLRKKDGSVEIISGRWCSVCRSV